MGMLDNIFKGIDEALKDIEEGGLERRLDNLASIIDKGSERVDATTKRIANAPDAALKFAETKEKQAEATVQQIGQKAKLVQHEAGKVMDFLPKKS
jgi:cell division septum initiation protein DivIVA